MYIYFRDGIAMLKHTTRLWSLIIAAACAIIISMVPFHSGRISAQDAGAVVKEGKEGKEVSAPSGKAKTDIRDTGADAAPIDGKKTEKSKDAAGKPVKQDLKKKDSPKGEAAKKKIEKKAELIKAPDKKKKDEEKKIRKTEPERISPDKQEPGKIAGEKKEQGKMLPERMEPEQKVIISREPVVIVINMGDPGGGDNLVDWHRRLNFREIAHWGRSHGIKPHRDSPPVDSRAARFVSKFGSKVKVEGLEPGRRYRMWVDFVTYDIVHEHRISARLEIFANREKIGNFNFASIKRKNNPVRLDLPYHLTMKGGLELSFREYSDQGGFWGIWDLVISDAYSLPESIDDKKTRASGMVEGGRIVEPLPAGREKIQKGTTPPDRKIEPKKSEALKKNEAGDKKTAPAPERRKIPVKQTDKEKKTEPKITVDPTAPREPRIDEGPSAPREPKTPDMSK